MDRRKKGIGKGTEGREERQGKRTTARRRGEGSMANQPKRKIRYGRLRLRDISAII